MTAERPVVLVVEEDPSLLADLLGLLAAAGYDPVGASDPVATFELAARRHPQLAVVSVNGGSGRDVVAVIRSREDTRLNHALPVILTGADPDALAAVRALNAGADDYILKPLSTAELLARVAALLRRVALDSAAVPYLIDVDGLLIDTSTRCVRVDGERVRLDNRAYRLLLALARKPTQVLTKRDLLRDLWGYHDHDTTRTLDTCACRLRSALGAPGRFVVNTWGVGYSLLPPS